jgi:hypothetical protein
MANAVDSKSTTRKGLRVRVPPSVPDETIDKFGNENAQVEPERSQFGHKVGHNLGASAPFIALAPDDPGDDPLDRMPQRPPAVPDTSVRIAMGRALSEGLARALAAGDTRAARIALGALSGLVDDTPEATPVAGAPVLDLSAERRKRGRL